MNVILETVLTTWKQTLGELDKLVVADAPEPHAGRRWQEISGRLADQIDPLLEQLSERSGDGGDAALQKTLSAWVDKQRAGKLAVKGGGEWDATAYSQYHHAVLDIARRLDRAVENEGDKLKTLQEWAASISQTIGEIRASETAEAGLREARLLAAKLQNVLLSRQKACVQLAKTVASFDSAAELEKLVAAAPSLQTLDSSDPVAAHLGKWLEASKAHLDHYREASSQFLALTESLRNGGFLSSAGLSGVSYDGLTGHLESAARGRVDA